MIEPGEIRSLRQHFPTGGPRCFPEEALALIYEKQLFRLFIPETLKGLEMPLHQALEVIEECAFADGDFGWAVQIGAGGGFFSGFMAEETARHLITDPKFVIAGSGFPAGKAHFDNGHYRLSGRWKYCSGSSYASLFTFSGKVDGPDQVRAFALQPGQVIVEDDWRAYGMRHTTSNSIVVKDQRVRPEMSFDFLSVENDYGYKLFYFPFMEFAKACILSTLAGCFRHLLEELETHITTARLSPEKKKRLQCLLDQSQEEDRGLKVRFYSLAEKCWDMLTPEKSIPDTDLRNFDDSMTRYTGFINERAYAIFNAVGIAATAEGTQLNKVWRDLTTAAQHMLLK